MELAELVREVWALLTAFSVVLAIELAVLVIELAVEPAAVDTVLAAESAAVVTVLTAEEAAFRTLSRKHRAGSIIIHKNIT
jgi:hypothetical protein